MTISSRRACLRRTVALAVIGLSAGAVAAQDAPPVAEPDPQPTNPAVEAPAAGQGPAASQSAATVQQPPALQGEVTEEQLQQFATAAAEVQKIQQEYAVKAQTLQKNTEQQIVTSVQDAGLSVAEFTAIVERMQTDPTLAERLDGLQAQGQ